MIDDDLDHLRVSLISARIAFAIVLAVPVIAIAILLGVR